MDFAGEQENQQGYQHGEGEGAYPFQHAFRFAGGHQQYGGHGGGAGDQRYGDRYDERLAVHFVAAKHAAFAGEDHLDGDQEQDDAASDAQAFVGEVHQLQKAFAKEHEGEQYRKGDKAFAEYHAAAAFRLHLLEGRNEEGNVTQRIGNQDQQDGGRQERGIHSFYSMRYPVKNKVWASVAGSSHQSRLIAGKGWPQAVRKALRRA